MARKSISSVDVDPVETNAKLLRVKPGDRTVDCPSCGRVCDYVPPDDSGGETVARCMSTFGGCGCQFTFRPRLRALSGPLTHFDGSGRVLNPAEAEMAVSAAVQAFGDQIAPEAVGTCDSGEGAAPEYKLDTSAQVRDNSSQAESGLVSAEHISSYDDIEDGPVQYRVQSLHNRKIYSQRIADRLEELGDSELSGAVKTCSSDVVLRHFIHSDQVLVRYANFCQKRILCACCEGARASRTISRWVMKIVQVMQQTGHLPWMFTLTVKNGADVVERLDHLFASLKKLNHLSRDYRRGKRPYTEWSQVHGSVWHTEIHRGSGDGLWHPHVHGLCLIPPDTFLDFASMRRDWESVTGDSFSFDAKKTQFHKFMVEHDMTPVEAFEDESDEGGRHKLFGDLHEVLKYAFKLNHNTTPDDVLHVYLNTFRKRLGRSYGSLYGLKTDHKLKDMAEAGGTGLYRDSVYAWLRNDDVPRYVRTYQSPIKEVSADADTVSVDAA